MVDKTREKLGIENTRSVVKFAVNFFAKLIDLKQGGGFWRRLKIFGMLSGVSNVVDKMPDVEMEVRDLDAGEALVLASDVAEVLPVRKAATDKILDIVSQWLKHTAEAVNKIMLIVEENPVEDEDEDEDEA